MIKARFLGSTKPGVNGEYKRKVQILGEDRYPVADTDEYPRRDAKFEIHRYYRKEDSNFAIYKRRNHENFQRCSDEILATYTGTIAGMDTSVAGRWILVRLIYEIRYKK